MLRLYVWLDDGLRRVLRREDGQDMIEYALIAALISIVVVAAAAGILEVAFGKWGKDVQKAIVKTCCD